MKKKVVFIADSLDNAYKFQQVLSTFGVEISAGSTVQIKKLLASTAHSDLIIFDGAPCNGVTDSVIMSTFVDEVLIVTKDSATPRAVLQSTKEALEKVDAPIAGVVLNNINKKIAKYYSYYGSYGSKSEK